MQQIDGGKSFRTHDVVQGHFDWTRRAGNLTCNPPVTRKHVAAATGTFGWCVKCYKYPSSSPDKAILLLSPHSPVYLQLDYWINNKTNVEILPKKGRRAFNALLLSDQLTNQTQKILNWRFVMTEKKLEAEKVWSKQFQINSSSWNSIVFGINREERRDSTNTHTQQTNKHTHPPTRVVVLSRMHNSVKPLVVAVTR